MRKGLEPFRALKLVDTEERTTCIACSDDSLYVGTAQGNLRQFSIRWSGGPEDTAATASPHGAVQLSPKRPIEQLCASRDHVYALADGVLSALPSAVQAAAGAALCRDAKAICLHTGADEVCVSFKKKIILYTFHGRSFEQKNEFPIAEAASALVWHGSWICAGFRREYSLYSDTAGVPREIYRFDGGRVVPQIAVAPNNELLFLIDENVGHFFSLNTKQPSPKNRVLWPRKVVSLSVVGNYIVGSTGAGQVDTFSVRDPQKNYQTLTVEGATVGICDAGGGRVLVATDGAVSCLTPVPFERQVQKLLAQQRISDALDLFNVSFSPDDPQWKAQLSRFHILAGWAFFRELKFQKAFLHFMYSADFQVARVLVFWQQYLPAAWSLAANASLASFGDGAPDPCDIADFIRARMQEKQQAEDRETLTANMDIANADMVRYLLKQREAFQNREYLMSQHPFGSIGDSCPLQRALDAVLLKLLIRADDPRLQEILKSGVHCTVDDCEKFLREHKRLDVLAHLWKAQGMYDLVLQELSSVLAAGSHGDVSAPPQEAKAASTQVKMDKIVAEMSDALKSASSCPGGADLLRKHVPVLLDIDPSSVLQIFTATPGHGHLTTDEVLRLFQGHNGLVLAYLEHLKMSTAVDLEPHHQVQLGLSYIARVAEEGGAAKTGPGIGGTRQKLLSFLEESEGLDLRVLLPRIEALNLHEERVVFCYREHQHQEALRILVVVLNDLPRAEIYCRITMARAQERPPPSKERVSIFSPSLPAWAQGVVFGPRSPSSSSGSAVPGEADAGRLGAGGAGGAKTGAAQPLMMLLRVLLDASVGAGQRQEDYPKGSVEYKTAALALMMGYAGHHDLPPHEVIGILPKDWALQDISSYLTKCARISLHEHRASLFETNLSAMAYLKTYSAWASERKMKVSITGDRCCYVCNRRFVDNDNIKAFVAYPNEVCVHLQCKVDLSICPKTGRNFKDNWSVYCNALGTESKD